MVKFEIDKKTFKTFLETCSMLGTVNFRNSKGVKRPLFSSFYLDVNPEGRLEVLAMDTVRKKTSGDFILEGVKIIEEGIIPIMDYDTIMQCLKGQGLDGKLIISAREDRGDILTLEDETDAYEIRQKDNKDIEILASDEVTNTLGLWKSIHAFDGEGGILVMHHPDAGDIEYPMKIVVKKDDLMKFVSDTLNIMKDNKTRLKFEDDVFEAYKGDANANIKSKHKIPFEDKGKELLDFDYEFYSLQAIFPNLFDEIEFNIKIPSQNNCINCWLRSRDKKTGIEVNIGLSSIIKE